MAHTTTQIYSSISELQNVVLLLFTTDQAIFTVLRTIVLNCSTMARIRDRTALPLQALHYGAHSFFDGTLFWFQQIKKAR